MHKGLLIGELAKRTGLNANTIRYYEAQGLLLPPERSQAGYRMYAEAEAERLVFIRKAKGIGLSLAEIKGIIEQATMGQAPCGRVAAILGQKIAEIDRRVEQWLAFREELAIVRERIQQGGEASTGMVCAYIEGLELKAASDGLKGL